MFGFFTARIRFFFENSIVAASAVAVALFALYALTAPKTVTLEDDGLFIMVSLDAGVAHPPGYPLFVFLGHLFSWLPLGTPAFRLHLLSALFGAIACGFLYLTGRRAGLHGGAAVFAALCWGLSGHFWSQAIIAEVYTLNALLCVATFCFCLQAVEGDKLNTKPLNPAALCFGLGLANHLPLTVLASPAFALLLLSHRRQVAAGLLLRLAAIAFTVAALFYVWMVWRSHHPVTAFYGPIEDFKSFWFFISRKGYAGVDVSPTAGAADTFAFILLFVRNLATQITPAGAALAVFGVYSALRAGSGKVVCAALCIIFAHSMALIFMLDFDYEDLKIAVFRPYPVTAYGFWALFAGCGLAGCAARTGKIARLAPLCAVLIPVYLLADNLRVNNRSQDRFADRHARTVLETLPPNAVFFVYGDSETGPMGYLRFAERLRPDVDIVSLQGLVYPDRLFSPVKDKKKFRNERILNYVKNSSRPLFLTSKQSLPGEFQVIDYGLYQQIAPDSQKGAVRLRVDENISDYLKNLGPYADSPDVWIRLAYSKIAHRAGGFAGYAMLGSSPELKRQTEPFRKLAMSRYHGLTGIAEVLIQHGQEVDLRRAESILERAEQLMEKGLSKERKGRHYYLRGFLAHRMGMPGEARKHFAHSVKLYPHKKNSSVKALESLR